MINTVRLVCLCWNKQNISNLRISKKTYCHKNAFISGNSCQDLRDKDFDSITGGEVGRGLQYCASYSCINPGGWEWRGVCSQQEHRGCVLIFIELGSSQSSHPLISHLSSCPDPYASSSFWSEWKAHRLSVNYASGCAVWLRILLIVEFCYLLNFANFPAFYLGYSIRCSLCVELLQVSVESRQLWTMKSWIPW